MSAKRLESARLLLKGRRGIEFDFFECSLSEIPLPDNSQDYIFCRFVFEYLQYPAKVFDELLRILAHGGKLVVGDLDYNCMTHYGLSEELESQLFELSGKLFRAKMLDPWVGRKLYSFFYSRKMREIKVHFSAHHLFYGDLPGRDLENWTAKLDQLSELQMKGGISLSFNMADFKAEFLRFLVDKSRFSYTPMLLVEGKKSA
jgi:ubiquinone/menaquinone biosynthesis C-methylase UbiE